MQPIPRRPTGQHCRLCQRISFRSVSRSRQGEGACCCPADDWPPISQHRLPPITAGVTALQQSCHARGVDTPLPCCAPVAGDAGAGTECKIHDGERRPDRPAFTCRYAALSRRCAWDYQAFVGQTLHFVIEELRAEFPACPSMWPWHNDSGCGDYQLDAVATSCSTGKIVAAGCPLPTAGGDQGVWRRRLLASPWQHLCAHPSHCCERCASVANYSHAR